MKLEKFAHFQSELTFLVKQSPALAQEQSYDWSSAS